jgi:cardiolipin synthase
MLARGHCPWWRQAVGAGQFAEGSTLFCVLALLLVEVHTSLVVLGGIALGLITAAILAGMFGPMPAYEIGRREELPANDSEDFLCLLEALADAKINRHGIFEVLPNGPNFYPAELEAIRQATRSVNLEAYIFQKSKIGHMYLDAMTERARAGVKVNLVLDAFGSIGATRSFFRPLLEAGGRVTWYNSPAWYRLMKLDNRTHRELLIVDGRIGFIGGAGIGDHWYTGVRGHAVWRDTMVRVEGDSVSNLQATFSENWLATSGELLIGEAYFPKFQPAHPTETDRRTAALVINSTPTMGGSTHARVLFQILLASAQRSISITTPYFLPDKSLSRELCRAVERGVRVRVLVPGKKSDHWLTRSTSRSGYGKLLQAGAEIFEYQPAMIHAKVLVVDESWAVVGSTNFDNRSFGLNDEVNLAAFDADLAARLALDMDADLKQSCRISLPQWEKRPVLQRAQEMVGWLFERQQ